MKVERLLLATALGLILTATTVWATGFGINGHIPSDAAADLIEGAGIEWVRIDFLWSLAEPERDRYDWSVYDALVDRLAARGLRIYAGLGDTPAWATSGSAFNGVPDDPKQWREFCYLAAARYATRIHAWGLWNEPNLDRFWEGTRREYIDEILLPGADAIRLGDPTALVAAPDLAHIGSADWDDWLFDSVAAARDVLDVVTHHVYPSYGWADTVTQDLQYGEPFPFSTPAVRDVLQDAGWWRRPFWLTETGVESREYGPSQQADFVNDLLRQWYGDDRRSRNWVDRIFFYELNDAPSPSPHTWGLVNGPPEFEPKSAYWAYQGSINQAQVMDAELLGSSIPAFFEQGMEVVSTIDLRNTGTLEWSEATGAILLVESVSAGWTIEVEQLGPEGLVEPGQTHSFRVRLRAPLYDGQPDVLAGDIRARMTQIGDDLFGDLLRVKVSVTNLKWPVIDAESDSAWVAPGRRTTLSVRASGSEPLGYRWLRNGVAIEDNDLYSGVRSPNLAITADDPGVAAEYLCEVSNAAGSVLSEPVTLVVGTAPPRGSGGRVEPDGDGVHPRPRFGGARKSGALGP
jgi:hypothetical protein